MIVQYTEAMITPLRSSRPQSFLLPSPAPNFVPELRQWHYLELHLVYWPLHFQYYRKTIHNVRSERGCNTGNTRFSNLLSVTSLKEEAFSYLLFSSLGARR
jgi:hypothetical protein